MLHGSLQLSTMVFKEVSQTIECAHCSEKFPYILKEKKDITSLPFFQPFGRNADGTTRASRRSSATSLSAAWSTAVAEGGTHTEGLAASDTTKSLRR